MNDSDRPAYTIQWFRHMNRIDRSAWDALALALETPFLEWEWLNLMETSGSIAPETGWLPLHLTVWKGNALVGAAPLYVKTHSAGEFVFDHAWEEVSEKMGIPYYPKLIGVSPVTPIPGYRFLIDPAEDEEMLTGLMVNAVNRRCADNGLSGCSFLFVDPDWQKRMTRFGFTSWTHPGFSWRNREYTTFEDYLSLFKTNQRRNIRRELARLGERGIRLETFCAERIPRHFFSDMYRLYEMTNDKFGIWGCKYLKEDFFSALNFHFRHRLVFVAAYDSRGKDRLEALAMFVAKNKRLYGRYWGSFTHIEYLHFAVCYYEPIRWAIDHRLVHFDPGIGGAHKTRRGFTAVPQYSLHRFYDRRMRRIMENHLGEINRMTLTHIDRLNQAIPFANKGADLKLR